VRADAGIRRAIDVIVENPVLSTAFLAEHLQLSVSRASKLVKQLVDVSILAPASGKSRQSQLYQADDILTLLSFGAEAGPRTPAPDLRAQHAGGDEHVAALIHRCGAATSSGRCRNRVPAAGDLCWRHRRAPKLQLPPVH
jgi:hypothetical protein